MFRSLKALSDQPLARIGRYLDTANAARLQLGSDPTDTLAQADYNFAAGRIVEIIEDHGLAPWDAPLSCRSGDGGEWSLRLPPPDPRPEYHPSRFEIRPTDRYKFRGKLVRERIVKQGLGAPVVAVGRDLDLAKIDPFAPPTHVFYGVTAVIRFGDGRKCEMVLADPLRHETVELDGHAYPLAADFQAPLALSLVELKPRKREIAELLKSAEHIGDARLVRLQPYDPKKIPVLFIHGLSDSSAVWMPMIDFLRSSEEIRRHYQFWVFNYPTGLAYPLPAATLRRRLDEMKEKYPEHKDIVVVGHSMGGMISRLLISDSNMALWDTVFEKPPGEMGFHEETRRVLTDILIFKARPDVSRVIYASASHRGSVSASGFLGRLMSRLIGNPVPANKITKATLAAARPGSPAVEGERLPNSMDVLKAGSPFLEAVDTLPPDPRIPFHSIIGDRGKGGNLDRTKPQSTDGVVPYWSSHLGGAESELILPSRHWTILHPLGMAEVNRILHLHLTELRSRGRLP